MVTKAPVKGSKCKYEKVTAFRLCPLNDRGNFSIDGERYKVQDI